MNAQLDKIRTQIDTIDQKILALITDRSALLGDVLQAKISQSNGGEVMVFHPKREQAIIQRLISMNASILSDHDIAHIYQAIMSVCRNVQISKLSHAQSFAVAIQGVKGSYSEQVVLKYCSAKNLKHYDIDYATTSENVLTRLSVDPDLHGIVALNNAQGGLVKETIDALSQHKYLIVDSIVLQVEHSLLALPGNEQAKIKQIYSHPQALKQCRDYLQSNYSHCELISWEDTALAAADLQTGKIPAESAVIAHKSCADDKELATLAENIQDLGVDNETLFLLITGKPDD